MNLFIVETLKVNVRGLVLCILSVENYLGLCGGDHLCFPVPKKSTMFLGLDF